MTITTTYPAKVTANKALAYWFEKGLYNSASIPLIGFIEVMRFTANPDYATNGNAFEPTIRTAYPTLTDIQNRFNSNKSYLLSGGSGIISPANPLENIVLTGNSYTTIDIHTFNILKLCGKLEANKKYIFENVLWNYSHLQNQVRLNWYLFAVDVNDNLIDITPSGVYQTFVPNSTISFNLETTEELKAVLIVPVSKHITTVLGYGYIRPLLLSTAKIWEDLN